MGAWGKWKKKILRKRVSEGEERRESKTNIFGGSHSKSNRIKNKRKE